MRPWIENVYDFKVGTCYGLYEVRAASYAIIAIFNTDPGNGHLQDVFDWFENSCKRDGYHLEVIELWNERFKNHLSGKRGFTSTSKVNVIKKFYATPSSG